MAFQDWAPREHLAAFAMIGILASDHEQRFNAESVAEQAFEVGDAMMVAVNKPRKPSPSPDLTGELVAAVRAFFAADHPDHFVCRMSDSEVVAIDRMRAILAKLPAETKETTCQPPSE